MFDSAFENAADTQQKMLDLTNEFYIHMQKQGEGAAEAQAKALMDYNKELAKTGVLSSSVFNALSAGLAQLGESPRAIAAIEPILGDVLVRAKGIRATAEDATALANALAVAAKTGTAKGLREFKLFLTPDDVERIKEYGSDWRGVLHYIMQTTQKYKGFSERAARTPLGQIQRFKNLMSDLSEDIGNKILPAQADMAKGWEEALPKLEPAILWTVEQLGKAMRWVAINASDFVVEATKAAETQNTWAQLATAANDFAKALGLADTSSKGLNESWGAAFGKKIADMLHSDAEDLERIAKTIQLIKDLWASGAIPSPKEMMKPGNFLPSLIPAAGRAAKAFVPNMKRIGAWWHGLRNVQESLPQPAPTGGYTNLPKYLQQPPPEHAYQKGGLATTTQTATLAEKGPEAVLPLKVWSTLTKTMTELNEQVTKLVDHMATVVKAQSYFGIGAGGPMGGGFIGGGGAFRGGGAGSTWGPAVEAGKAAIRATAGAPGGPVAAPVGELVGTLAEVRKQYAEEAANPEVQRAMFQRTAQEVGVGTGPKSVAAQQAFQEELFNRAAARKQSLWQAINDPKYYPEPVFNKSVSGATAERFRSMLGVVQAGSNISKWATGNASLGVGFGWGSTHGGETLDVGERFGWEKRDYPWIKKMMAVAQDDQRQKEKQGDQMQVAQNAPQASTEAPPLIRAYQQGGIAMRPQLAMLAEKGPEVVLPQPSPSGSSPPPIGPYGAKTSSTWTDIKNALAAQADVMAAKHLPPWAQELYATAKTAKLGAAGEGPDWSEITGPYGFTAPYGWAPGAGPRFLEKAGEGIGKLAASQLINPALQRYGDTVHFSPNVSIHGNADDSVISRLEIKLRDISKNFVRDFKHAQIQERRLSYEAGG